MPAGKIDTMGDLLEQIMGLLSKAKVVIDADLPPDPTLSKTILTSRMKGRYKDEARSNQAVIINISGPEANL